MTEIQKQQLLLPFPASDIEWRTAYNSGDKTKGFAVPFVDSRAIQERLDKIFGPENWQNEFAVSPSAEDNSSAYVCTISVYSPERNEWIKKSDGSGATDIEPVKGGLSGALKRAASVLGIGRYLYDLEGLWVEIEQRGKSYVIKESEYKKLAVHYNKQMAERKKGFKAENTENPPAEQPKAPDAAANADIKFRVIKSAVRNGAKGTQTMLTLQSPQNRIITGYMRGNPDLREGQIIHKLQIEERESETIGKYNIIRGFEKAASGDRKMKKNAETATAVIVISAILLLTVTAETAILLSGIWTREKYTLAFLVLAAGIALVYLLFKAFEEKTLKKGYDKASEEISLLERQADELNRALKISEHNLKTLKETEPEYKRKSEVLESYRNSFPCLVQPGYTVFNVIRTEVMPDKYSRWLIVGEFGDELWKTTIIRRDMQTYGEMLTLISKTETPDGITELNEQNALPWE